MSSSPDPFLTGIPDAGIGGNESLLFDESQEEVLTSPSLLAKLLISVISLILIVAILGGNGLVLLLLMKFSKLRTTTNFLLLGMASADFTVGISLIASVVTRLNPNMLTDSFHCLVFWCSVAFSALTSCWTLFFVSFDRFLKIVFPLWYYYFRKPHQVALPILFGVYAYAAIIMYAIPLTVANTLDKDYGDIACWFRISKVWPPSYLQFLVYGNIISPLLLSCILHTTICLTVVINKNKIRRHGLHSGHLPVVANAYRQELKTVKTLIILLCLCISGWFPFSSVLLSENYIPSYQAGLGVRSLVGYMAYLNSALNPLVYCLRSEHFRNCTRKLFCGNKGARKRQISVRRVFHSRSMATVYPLAVIVVDPRSNSVINLTTTVDERTGMEGTSGISNIPTF